MLDDSGAKNLQEEVCLWLFILPQPPALFLRFLAGADSDEHDAVRLRLVQRAVQAQACEGNAVNENRVPGEREALRLARVEPGPAVLPVPTSRPFRQILRSAIENVAARITEQTGGLLWRDIDHRHGAGQPQRVGQRAHGIASTGLNWQPSTK